MGQQNEIRVRVGDRVSWTGNAGTVYATVTKTEDGLRAETGPGHSVRLNDVITSQSFQVCTTSE